MSTPGKRISKISIKPIPVLLTDPAFLLIPLLFHVVFPKLAFFALMQIKIKTSIHSLLSKIFIQNTFFVHVVILLKLQIKLHLKGPFSC